MIVSVYTVFDYETRVDNVWSLRESTKIDLYEKHFTTIKERFGKTLLFFKTQH